MSDSTSNTSSCPTKGEKRCTVCGQMKPFEDYRPYRGRGKHGLRPLCKVCQREYEKKWRSNSKEYRRKQRQKRKEKDAEYKRRWISENRAEYLIAECRRRCQKAGIPFDLYDYVEDIRQRIAAGVCEITGHPLKLIHEGGRSPDAPSIHRINPKAGYVYSNIKIVCYAVNMAISDWGEEEFKKIVRSWIEKGI